MNRFVVKATRQELDLPLCVTAGQVFRWGQSGPSTYSGVDGDDWYAVEVGEGSLTVSSNVDESSFRTLFRLDEPLEDQLRTIVDTAPELQVYVDALPGLRVMRPSNPVEEAVCFLCTVNNNIKRITGMVRTLASCGPVIGEHDGACFHRFPELDVVAGLDEEWLRSKGFGYRARTIPSIARQIAARGGSEWLESLKRVDYRRAHDELNAIEGIGPKLADCICLFALHHLDSVPVDTHLWQATVRLYFPLWKGKSLTSARYREIGDFYRARFGKLAGVAHQYLFYDNMKNWRAYQRAQQG